MADNLDALANWLTPLLAAIEPAGRRALAVKIAADLRQDTQAHMRAQTGPDGQAWQPRKPPSLREQAAATRKRRGPMMPKLRQARYLQRKATPDAASLSFAERVLRIARVHHFGEIDRVAIGGPQYPYPARPLLGISDEMTERIKAVTLAHLQTSGA